MLPLRYPSRHHRRHHRNRSPEQQQRQSVMAKLTTILMRDLLR
jgi:hypothetical protein